MRTNRPHPLLSARSRHLWLLALLLAAPATVRGAAPPDDQNGMEQLLDLNFQELASIRLTSAARKEQKLVETTAAVTVIDQEQIRRSGMTSIPELLRLVPGVHVARINASNWAISARGFNGQFSNKLLVLMDGRTLYSPLFAGVFWSLQDLAVEDVERIEVIRGPGSTLWGSNAVNGVINIITKKTTDTHGNQLTLAGGTTETLQGSLRHGGRVNDKLDYRLHLRGFNHDNLEQADGTAATDGWRGRRGGFRTDWHLSARDELMLQGEIHTVREAMNVISGERNGGHLLARWSRTPTDDRHWSLQLYFDRNVTEAFEQTHIYDLDWQYAIRQEQHAWMWGAGFRLATMDMEPSRIINWQPEDRRDRIFNLFVQDEITLDPQWRLTVGTKLEHNDYTGLAWQPNARLLWRPDTEQSLWAAISRAVRVPARVDADLNALATINATTRLSLRGNPEITPETLLAYELGYRTQLKPELSLELAAFFNQYDHLVSTENLSPLVNPPNVILQQRYDNQALANSYGLETALDWRVRENWRLRAAHAWMQLHIDLLDHSRDTTTPASADNNPVHQWQLRSQLDLPHDLEFDTALYHTSRLTNLQLPATTRLDLRLGWRPHRTWNLSLIGQNLLDARHPEFTGTTLTADEIPRSFLARMEWSF